MDFEWDEDKSESCSRSRGFDFAFAARVFFDPNRIVVSARKANHREVQYYEDSAHED